MTLLWAAYGQSIWTSANSCPSVITKNLRSEESAKKAATHCSKQIIRSHHPQLFTQEINRSAPVKPYQLFSLVTCVSLHRLHMTRPLSHFVPEVGTTMSLASSQVLLATSTFLSTRLWVTLDFKNHAQNWQCRNKRSTRAEQTRTPRATHNFSVTQCLQSSTYTSFQQSVHSSALPHAPSYSL